MLSSKKTNELNNNLLFSVPSRDRIGSAYTENLKDQIQTINICFVSSITKENKYHYLNFNLKDYSKFFPSEKILEHIANYYFEILSDNAISKKESCEKFDSTLLYPNPKHKFYYHLNKIILKNINEIFRDLKVINSEIAQQLSQGNPFLQNFAKHNQVVQNLILKAIKIKFDLNDNDVFKIRDKLLLTRSLASPDLQARFSGRFQSHIYTPVVRTGPARFQPSTFPMYSSTKISNNSIDLESRKEIFGKRINNQTQALQSKNKTHSIFQSPSLSPKNFKIDSTKLHPNLSTDGSPNYKSSSKILASLYTKQRTSSHSI